MKDNNAAKRILHYSDAEIFRKHGWKAADLHVHTIFSPDVISVGSMQPDRLYRTARENGMDYVTFTDHDTLDAYETLNPDMPGLVSGVEIKVKDRSVGHTIHVNVYELDRVQFQMLEEIAAEGDLHGFLDCLERERLPFVYNHPLWFEPGERPNLKAIPDLVELFPVIEYNMHRVRRKNEMIVELAARYKKGLIASTDTHSGMIGQAYTLSRGKSFREFYNNICEGKSFIVVRDLTKQNLVQEMKLWLDLLSGQEDIESGRKIHTGISQVDRLIRLLSSNTLRDFPRVYRAFLAATYRLAGSGVPAAIYIRRECFRICEMEQQLGIYAR